ncbi:MAG: T9SS type A sorting domain-containing protein [Bacteroidetes bacterium]|nr:T9SS type A sorting domain-containing protein [Bacteroidota bacterium]
MVDGIFTASNSPTSGNFDLTLYNTGYTNAANAWTIMANSGGPWTLANGTCVLSPVTAVRRNAMNGLYEFGTAQGPSALPVQWLSVNAIPLKDRIRINWATASEENNNGFEVEKLDASTKLFESITWLSGAGNSNQVNYYSFDDVNVVANEDYFYKIRQVDFNGVSSYSEVVHARLNHSNTSHVQFYPNPITADSKLIFDLENTSSVKISIVNVLGERVAHEELGMLKRGKYEINITTLFKEGSLGLYTVSVEMNGLSEHLKVLYINDK